MSFFQPSIECINEFQTLAHDLVEESVRYFENIVYNQDGKLDPVRFRLHKEKNQVLMYRESRVALVARVLQCRPSGYKHQKVAEPSHDVQLTNYYDQKPGEASSRSSSSGPMDQLESVASLPMIIALGSVPGTLEETMLGVSLQDRSSYCSLVSNSHKKMLVARLLANLTNPAAIDDKHYHLGVHWTLHDSFRALGAQTTRKFDQLNLAHSKMTTSSKGERLGVCVLHSIEHPDVPKLNHLSITRLHASLSITFREKQDGTVDFVARATARKISAFVHPIMLKVITDILSSIPQCIEFTNSRKLLAMVFSDSSNMISEVELASSTQKRMARRLVQNQCAGCYKVLHSVSRSFSSTCRICQACVCARCCVTKEFDLGRDTDGVALVHLETMRFCISCVQAAKKLSIVSSYP